MNVRNVLEAIMGITLVITLSPMLQELQQAAGVADIDALDRKAPVAVSGDNIYIIWWERNQTSNEPATRVSSDNGLTFGPALKLAANGTLSGDEAEETEELVFQNLQ